MLLLCSFVLFSTSCDKEDPEIINEEEVITTLTYTLTPQDGGAPVVMSFRDLDGDGGNAPTITGGTLNANATYSGSLVLLNEQESPAEDITTEIREEAEEHQFFFISDDDSVTASYNTSDVDADGLPVGLIHNVTTTDAGSANLTVILRHEPSKTAENDPNAAGGETDIEVTFPITVQ